MLSILFFQDFAKAQNDSAKNITCDTSVFKIRVKYFIAVVLFLPSFALAQLVHNMIRKSQTKHELTLSSRKIEKDTILYKSVNGNDSVRQILYHGKKSKTKTYKTITYFEDGKIARIFNFKSAPGRKTYIGSYYYPDGNIEKYSRGGIKKGRHGYRSMRRVHYSYYPKGKIESLTKKGLFRSLTYKEWDKNGRIMKDTSTQD